MGETQFSYRKASGMQGALLTTEIQGCKYRRLRVLRDYQKAFHGAKHDKLLQTAIQIGLGKKS